MNIETPQKISFRRMTTSAPILDSSIEPERRRTGIEDRVKKVKQFFHLALGVPQVQNYIISYSYVSL